MLECVPIGVHQRMCFMHDKNPGISTWMHNTWIFFPGQWVEYGGPFCLLAHPAQLFGLGDIRYFIYDVPIYLILCQCYLCTIRIFFINTYGILSHAFHPHSYHWRKPYQPIAQIMGKWCTSFREYFSMIYSAAPMSAMDNHVEPCTAVLKMQ